MKLWLYTLAAVATTVLALAGGGALGAAIDTSGCTAQNIGRGDDNSSAAVMLPFSVNFFGTTYNSLFVNNNGNVTFDAPLADYTPVGMPNLHRPLIAPFFADVDTRNPGSGVTSYGETTFGGRAAFCVVWDKVGYFNTHANRLDDFQLLLVDRSDRAPGDFDTVMNYGTMNWETGDSDSGVDGLGGLAAEVGFTNADQHFSMIGSQVSGAFLDTNPAGLAHGSFNAGDVAGRYVFRIRNGSPGLGSPVSGSVRDNGGSIVPDTLLQLCPHGGAGGESCLTTNSRSDGSYTFVDVLDGAWDLVAFPPEASALSGGSLTGIQVSGAALTERNVTLVAEPPTPPPLNGLVHTAAGDPLAGATVTVLSSPTPDGRFLPVPDGSTLLAPGARANPVTTGATGAFAFDAITGYYRIQASKEGCFAAGDQNQSYAESPTLALPPAPAHVVLTLDCSDVIPPVITVNAPSTVEATSAAGAQVSFTVVAVDNVDGPVTVTCDRVSGSTFPLGDTSVACSASDAAGNSAAETFTVSVVDTTPPALTVPATITVAAGAPVTFAASASDLVDGPLPATCDRASGSAFPLGTTTVHCNATDAHHNTGSGQFDVIVTPAADIAAPVLTMPDPITTEATSASGARVAFTVSALDGVDGVVPVTCDSASGSTFALGITTVHCQASDAAGNTGSASFTVTVVDTTAPALHVPESPLQAEAASASGAAVAFAASANDLVDGAVAVVCSPASGATFPLETTTVQCTATDSHHNTANAHFDVVVSDTTAPTVHVPATLTVEATSPTGATVTFSVSASDLVDGAIPATCSKAPGSTFPLGTSTVHCTAKDAHGNIGIGDFMVAVNDTTPPVISVPATIIVSEGSVVTFTVNATDLVDGAVPVTCDHASGATLPVGTTNVMCQAKDAAGNTATASFGVVVTPRAGDTTPPVLTVPTPISVNATSPSGAVVAYTASAVDAVDGSVPVTCTKSSAAVFPIGTTTVTCSARDKSGNLASQPFTVHVSSAKEQLDTLLAEVTLRNLGPGTSFATKLRDAIGALQPLAPWTTCLILKATENEAGAQAGKKLTVAQAEWLRGELGRIERVLGC